MLFVISLIESESLAAKANLKAIAKACRAGKVATLEMAEMLGMPELEQINSEKTSMIAVRRDEKSESVRFIFSADVDSDMIEFMLVIVWAAATLTAALVASMCVYVKRHCLKAKRNPTNQEIAIESGTLFAVNRES